MQPNQRQESLDPEDWDAMRTLAHRMVDDALTQLETVRERPVWQPMPADMATHFAGPAPTAPAGAEAAYQEFLDTIAPYPMGTPHPRFWAWYMGSGTVISALADFLAGMMNSNLGGGNHAANLVEEQVINWLKSLLGLPESAGGLLVSGGSMANLTGLAVARNCGAGFDVRAEGLVAAPQRLTVYASTEVHSSNQKAVELLGLGTHSLRKVPVHADYTIDLAALAALIAADRAEGCRPICVIGSAGTVNTGAIDDLNGLADLCQQEEIWLHVDGAIGAVAMLAESVRPQLAGIERADSVALDLHKWMHIPFEAGCVLVRDVDAQRSTFSLTPEYLEHGVRGLAAGHLWFSDLGLQLSRQFRALKVWMAIKEHVEQMPELELMAPIGLDIVCFRFNPGGLSDEILNALNKELLIRLQEQGIAAPSYTTLHGLYCLRIAVANHRSEQADFDLAAQAIVRIGRELVAEGA
jgi:glutamate/tyrosine decarboxylase-like PLP-dependent enzyme